MTVTVQKILQTRNPHPPTSVVPQPSMFALFFWPVLPTSPASVHPIGGFHLCNWKLWSEGCFSNFYDYWIKFMFPFLHFKESEWINKSWKRRGGKGGNSVSMLSFSSLSSSTAEVKRYFNKSNNRGICMF